MKHRSWPVPPGKTIVSEQPYSGLRAVKAPIPRERKVL